MSWDYEKRIWWQQVLLALDQLGCALVGGWADETMSSYLWRLEERGKLAGKLLRPVVDAIALHLCGTPDHCFNAMLTEMSRRHLPPVLRDQKDKSRVT